MDLVTDEVTVGGGVVLEQVALGDVLQTDLLVLGHETVYEGIQVPVIQERFLVVVETHLVERVEQLFLLGAFHLYSLIIKHYTGSLLIRFQEGLHQLVVLERGRLLLGDHVLDVLLAVEVVLVVPVRDVETLLDPVLALELHDLAGYA